MASLIRNTSTPTHLVDHEDDEHAEQRGYIKGTDFALPYFSQWSRLHDVEASQGLLRHVNCGYLSTCGVPPTLLALKQHAQSLCVLIHMLSPTVHSGQIGVGGLPGEKGKGKVKNKKQTTTTGTGDPQTALQYQLNDAFDFLTDLSVPYTNDDPDHHKTLNALVNEVRGRSEVLGTTYHCPFAETTVVSGGDGEDGKTTTTKEKARPYASHHNLIMHANACLERLDHEFSATGGLLSLLPYPADANNTNPINAYVNNTIHNNKYRTPEADALHAAAVARSNELTNARNSLLGQWLHFTQSLVARMRELERAYADALDALAGEAAVPVQMRAEGLFSSNDKGEGTGVSGREVAYPQDRWVLVNAGDEAFDLVHELLDRKEAEIQAREGVWRKNGVIGDVLWEWPAQGNSQDDDNNNNNNSNNNNKTTTTQGHARGLVAVDITTRYYRLTTPPNASNPQQQQQQHQKPKTPLFLLPAYGYHPSVAYTRDHLPQNPTNTTSVISNNNPKIPTLRATDLEKRYAAKLQQTHRTELANAHLLDELERAREENGVLRAQVEGLARGRDGLLFALAEGADREEREGKGGNGKGKGKGGGGLGLGLVERLQEQRERAARAEREVVELRRGLEGLRG